MLKLYPAFLQTTVTAQILLKALTNLPHTDFTLCKCMIDQAHASFPLHAGTGGRGAGGRSHRGVLLSSDMDTDCLLWSWLRAGRGWGSTVTELTV